MMMDSALTMVMDCWQRKTGCQLRQTIFPEKPGFVQISVVQEKQARFR